MSASNIERLSDEGLFADSPVKPAIRANDTTDIWRVRGGTYHEQPSRPFRSASLARTMYGTATPMPGAADHRHRPRPLLGHLQQRPRRRHAPRSRRSPSSAPTPPRAASSTSSRCSTRTSTTGIDPEVLPHYINDCILRCLAGVHQADRPQFLKIVYNGPKALEELASFDPEPDRRRARRRRRHHARLLRAAAPGARSTAPGSPCSAARSTSPRRRSPSSRMMREVADGNLSPQEAVRAYHGELQKQRLKPQRAARGRHGDHRGRAQAAVNRRGHHLRRQHPGRRQQGDRPAAAGRAALRSSSPVTPDTGGPGLNMAVNLARLGCGFPRADGRGWSATTRTAGWCSMICSGLGIGVAGVGVVPGVPHGLHRRDDRARQRPAHLLPLPGCECAARSGAVRSHDRHRARIFHLGAPGVHERMDRPTAGRQRLRGGPGACPGRWACAPTWSWSASKPRGSASWRCRACRTSTPSSSTSWRPPPSPGTRIRCRRQRELLRLGVHDLAVVHFRAGCVAAAADGQILAAGRGAGPGN